MSVVAASTIETSDLSKMWNAPSSSTAKSVTIITSQCVWRRTPSRGPPISPALPSPFVPLSPLFRNFENKGINKKTISWNSSWTRLLYTNACLSLYSVQFVAFLARFQRISHRNSSRLATTLEAVVYDACHVQRYGDNKHQRIYPVYGKSNEKQ